MSHRSLAFSIFAAIALLLSVKAGITIVGLQTAPAITSTPAQTGVVSSPLASTESPSSSDTLAAITQPGFIQFLPNVIGQAYAENISQPAQAGAASEPVSDDMLQNFRKQQDGLNDKQRQLDAREKSIRQAEEKLNIRITELEQLESSIQQRLLDEKNIKDKKIKRLTAVYEGMKPESAAPVLSQMELATVVRVFLLMDEKKVGKILSFMSADKAVQISQALTSQISTVK